MRSPQTRIGKRTWRGCKRPQIIFHNNVCLIFCLIFYVSPKKHDKKLADETDYYLPKGSKLFQDTGRNWKQGFKDLVFETFCRFLIDIMSYGYTKHLECDGYPEPEN